MSPDGQKIAPVSPYFPSVHSRSNTDHCKLWQFWHGNRTIHQQTNSQSVKLRTGQLAD